VKVTYGESDNEAIPPGCSKLITADFLISDACGNINPDTFTCQYLIIDNIAPEWVTPAGSLDFSMECSDQAAFDFANSQVPVASDNCPGNIRIFKEEGQFVAGLDCPSEGTITNVFVAVDTCDNSSEEFVQVIALFDNTAPEIDEECLTNTVNIYTEDGYSCPQLAEVSGISEGATYNLQTSWSVGGYLIEGLPEGCVTDNCTDFENIILHVVSIETTDDLDTCARTIVITLQFEDQCGNLQEEPMVLTYNIIDNTPPEINSQILSFGGNEIFIDQCYPTALDAEIDAIAAVQAVAFDNCTATELLDYEATTTGTCAAVVTVTVTDCAGNTATHTFNTRIDGDGPTMTAGTLMTLCYRDTITAEAFAKDATTIVDACSPFSQLDIVASIVGSCPATITVTATDACGNSNSVVYNNICIGTGNAVEITTEAANQSADCTMETTVFNTWIANNGGAIASGSGVTWTYSETAYTFDCNAHSKSKTVTFVATDNCGFTDSSTATFTVTDNMAPSANMISATNLTCVANIPMPNTALVTGVSDNCDQTPTVALFFQSSNSGTGCPNSPLTIMRTYSVTDDYCNTTYVTHTINVVDNVAPTFTAPANITINVDAMCNYDASVGVTGDVTNEQDGCSSGLNATFTDVVNSGSTQGVRWIISRTWSLTDACGNSAIPQIQTITVIDNILPTISCPGNVSVVGSIQDNICVAQVNNIGPGVSNDNCGVASITFTLTGATTSSGTGNASGKFFKEGETTVTYIVTDRSGNTATCSFTVTVTCTTISGKIIWEHNHIPGPPPSGLGVKDATVRLTLGVNQVGSTLTDVAGNYTLIAPGNATYQVTPVKNINRLNGVTAADATLIQQHVTNMNVITDPYKKIAADVNRNGAISGQDANLITQSLAGNVTALGIFNVFWRFVPTSTVLPVTAPLVVPTFTESISVTTTGPDVIDQNFYGVKLGDVNGSGNPALAPTGTPLVWVLRDRTLQTGADLVVDFAATNFNDLAALQFALDFDPSVLQFTGFESTDAIALGADNFGAAEAGLGALRVVWAQANGTTLADGTPVLRAKFKVLQGGQLLSEVLNLDPVSMDCSAYTEALVPSDVRVVYATSVATGDPLSPGKPALQLFQNQPNPFAGETTIGFVLPDACDAQLRITDVSGRELASYNRTYSAGYHEIEFRMQNAVAYGVLYYELTTPFGKLTRKMVTTGK
jgi:HYR domain/Dockerin type I domain